MQACPVVEEPYEKCELTHLADAAWLICGNPPGRLYLPGIWLHDGCDWGQWTIWVGVILGVTTAADGLRQSLKAMERMSGSDQDKTPPVGFNDHD